jgi:hypothetical protein
MDTGRSLGFSTIYTETGVVSNILERLGWLQIGASHHIAVECGVYEYWLRNITT